MKTYFIQNASGGPIKIGKTLDIDHRLSQLQCGSVDVLVCLAYVPGDREDAMHERFDHLRLTGEWFTDGPELLEFVATKARRCGRSRPSPTPEASRRRRARRKEIEIENAKWLEKNRHKPFLEIYK